jgi:hypothetical protein
MNAQARPFGLLSFSANKEKQPSPKVQCRRQPSPRFKPKYLEKPSTTRNEYHHPAQQPTTHAR